jgi:DNA-binding sugar fermentation-stimulating protein
MFLYQVPNVSSATVIKRPSKTCKTPYVADVKIENDETTHMAHTACLGCCGLVDAGKEIVMKKVNSTKNVCKYRVSFAKVQERDTEHIVGVDPKLAEDMVEVALQKNYISILKDVKEYQREKRFLNSRFDYCGVDANNLPFIMEVKNVPLADYVDCLAKEKKGLDFSERDMFSKIAYFPDGYRKKQTDVVSPRALKHITELTEIALDSEKSVRTIMCYVVQRRDAMCFQASNVDPIYKEAFNKAHKSGVEIIVLQIGWNADGVGTFIRDDLPINFD